MSRYEKLFATLKARNEGAFVPFIMLGDPTPEAALETVRAAVAGGADALELGVPFSDPVADGPTIQASHIRALKSGATVDGALAQIRTIRQEFPELPIGMLIYGNVPFTRGLEKFYQEFAEAGADSILIPDVPVREGAPFIAAAEKAGVAPIFIAPAQGSPQTLEGVAKHSKGYIYAISRDGVTGAEKQSQTTGLEEVVANVQRFGGAPVLLGFGISTPEHVAAAIKAGAAGAITGSALTTLIQEHPGDVDAVREFVASMKAATKR
ncbi:tryptophan synthase alpha chain [Corynebacterium phocae]|uniref:Tryptophan synthase alpha chain n=1 Tax=Corynebacterium phocae TaxID=161895 RepID=A0A1L7D5R1_9CORY|nr:tryptophan synthase subunit alpha [Corynebacterium phocae]APT93506.1 tryptophan synthase alpha chain [Corynebacterium phocae]KAA8720586.1 tryptophan synthase subunit alpha [Corynebacterium phocae]